MRWFLCAFAFLLCACHTLPSLDGTQVPSEAVFRDMWARYSDCRSGSRVIQTESPATGKSRGDRFWAMTADW